MLLGNQHRMLMDIPDPNEAESVFYAGALGRISQSMVVLAVILSAAAWLRLGWHIALGFVCGCSLAYLNFHWLKKVVNALGERMGAGQAEIGQGSRETLPFTLCFDGSGGLCYIHCFGAPAFWDCWRACSCRSLAFSAKPPTKPMLPWRAAFEASFDLMPEQLWFTAFLNHLFANQVTALLRAIHIEPQFPQAPITNGVAMELLVFGFLVILFAMTRSRLSVEKPGGLQHVFEGLHGFVQGQSEEMIGHGVESFTPFLVVLMLFILICNLIGVIPGFESPTGLPVVPLGCAICAFVYYQAQGFKHHGIAYLKHFMDQCGGWPS